MLWSLLRGSGYGYGSYDDEATTKPEVVDASTLELDPIQCAGSANMRALRTASVRVPFVLKLLTAIACLTAFRDLIDPQVFERVERRHQPYVSERYAQHFQDLIDSGVLRRVRRERLKFTSSYFAVPKRGSIARAIFNGKSLSACFKTPPPVNIPSITAIIEKLQALNKDGNGFAAVVGDFRHFFHQISINAEIQPYFGLQMGHAKGSRKQQKRSRGRLKSLPASVAGASSYMWRTLPMGWSYSPAVAQATAWRVLSFCEEGETDFLNIDGLESCPMFVEFESGFAAIYYDNYIVAGTDPKIVEAMSHRIIRNCRNFGIVIKEHEFHSRKDLLGKKPLKFLGIEFHLKSKRMRDGRTRHLLEWRTCPFSEEHRHMALKGGVPYSPRTIACYVGKILYCRLTSLKPLGTEADTRTVLAVLRRSSRMAWAKSWRERCIRLSSDEIRAFDAEWRWAGNGPWNVEEEFIEPDKYEVVATDACDSGWAAVRLTLDGTVIESTGYMPWPSQGSENEVNLKDHIFLKEMYAAVHGTLWARKRSAAARFHVVVDNTAVAGALARGYSTNTRGTTILETLKERIHVITTISADNVADSPSRNEGIQESRRKATHACVVNALAGLKIGVPKRHPNVQHNGLRHCEGIDDDVVLDQIPAECMHFPMGSTSRQK